MPTIEELIEEIKKYNEETPSSLNYIFDIEFSSQKMENFENVNNWMQGRQELIQKLIDLIPQLDSEKRQIVATFLVSISDDDTKLLEQALNQQKIIQKTLTTQKRAVKNISVYKKFASK